MSEVFKPRDYQQAAMQHVFENRRCALWMRMGGGKTATALTALEHLSVVEDVYPALVLAPVLVADATWPDEVAKWGHLKHLRVSRILGNPKQRAAGVAADAEIYVMNYENLTWLQEHCGDDWPFRTVIADESTRLKSFRLRQGGKRAQALSKPAWHHVTRFIELTGTPSPNGLLDLWGQIWFLDKGDRLGKSFTAFEQRWFRRGYDGYSLVPFEHSEEEIKSRLKDICLTVDTPAVDEPVETVIGVSLPPKAREMYRQMEKEAFATLERDGADAVEVEASQAAVKFGKCLQIANGSVYHGDGGEWEAVHDVKLKALESVVEEAAGMPVLVSYVFKPDAERILKHFKGAVHLRADNVRSVLKKWNAGEIPVLVAHPQTAGHGLNMAEGGNILVDFGVSNNLEHDQQIVERIGPLRQKSAGFDRPTLRYRIVAKNTLEQTVSLPRIKSKASLQDALMDAMRRRKSNG